MKVICTDNLYYPLSLVVGNIYFVVKETKEFYIILDKNQEEYNYPKQIFEISK